MEAPTIELITPDAQIKVVIREWITGRMFEYTQEPLYSATNLQQVGDGFEMKSFDTKSAVVTVAHRQMEAFVVSVGTETDPKKCVEAILDMSKTDYLLISDKIAELNKPDKKKLQA